MTYSRKRLFVCEKAKLCRRYTILTHLDAKVRGALGLPAEFVLHSLRHTFCTRLGEEGTKAFQIRLLAGHHSVTVSEGYVHPPRSLRFWQSAARCRNLTLSGASTDTGTLALSVSH
jgi:integrase